MKRKRRLRESWRSPRAWGWTAVERQRGGKPTPMDRILATRFGASAVDLIAEGDYGKMVIKKGEKIKSIYLSEVGSKLSLVPPDHKLIKKARGLDICFGT